MKVIREIKQVMTCTEYDSNFEEELTLDSLENEPGYYEHVIRPMLKPGHEGELVCWLKTIGLIPEYLKCKNAEMNENCKKPLSWYTSKSMDNYQWKCLNCQQTYSIRENSLFHDIKCNFKDAIRVFLGWCKEKDTETLMKILGVKKQTINFIFKICTNTAQKYIQSHLSSWKIGGPQVIVVIDTYPEGYQKFIENEIERTVHPILCIAEVKEIPPRYWFEVLNQKPKTEKCKAALQTIYQMVRPGSIIVCNRNSSYCSLSILQALNHLYPTIISVESLEMHNSEYQNILTNLQTIWQPAMDLCSEASLSDLNTHAFLINKMWNRNFGVQAFEALLNQLSYPET